jgi:cell division protein FtsN
VTLAKRDSRSTRRPSAAPRDGAGGTLLGIFIGLALGLALAAGVAWTLIGGRTPAPAPAKAPEPSVSRDARAPKAAAAPAPADKDRFDFYKILPGGEEPKLASKGGDRAATDKATTGRAEAAKAPDKVAAAEPSATKAAKPGERFWLQAGSFTQESDAENLKARLALAGWEAQVQPGTLPDKGVRFRVRLGPYDNADELNRIKGQLAQRGFEAAVIKF